MERRIPKLEQMRDVRVVDWTLKQLYGARLLEDEERVAELERLLSVPVARCWLESRHQGLAPRVMEALSPQSVEELAPELEARFFELDETLARQFLLRLAEQAPLRALSLLEEVVARAGGPKDAMAMAFVVQACGRIGSAANALLEQVVKLCVDQDAAYHLYWSGLFGAMARLGRPTLARDVAKALVATDGPGFEGESILKDVFEALAPGCPFLEMLFDIEFRQSGYRFGDLPELFRKEAPVEELDRLAESLGDSRMDHALRRLPQVGPGNGVARFARQLTEELPTRSSKRVRRFAYLTVIAASAAQYQCNPDSWHALPYDQLVDIVTADISYLPNEESLISHLVVATGPRELERLHREVDVARGYRGAARLVRILLEVGHPSSIPTLIRCLDLETDELAADLAVTALAKLGDQVLDPIAKAWPDLDEFSRMRALDAMGTAGSPAAADHILHYFADVVDDELPLGAWCEAAQAVPDRRYVTLLDSPRYQGKEEIRRTLERVKALVA